MGLANVFGFASTLYFCIPDNPQLRALRDTIDDRLFKIRHCQDIDGVVRHLPLFEPPIDPALLVQAAAQGLSLSSVLNDLNSPMPNYRFYYLLQKALELCSEVRALGNAFLSAKEKGNAEELSQLRAKHESSIHNLVMEVKKQQLDEAGKAMDALQQSRKGPAYRLQHNLKLIGEDLGKVPDGKTDFTEVPDAFMDYARCPRRFHSSRFKSLDRFLYTSAWRNVADSLTADARRRRREARFVRETAFHDGSPKFTDQSVGIGSNTTPWLLDVATDDSERQALKRWLLGERRTGPLAQSLCFDGLPVPAQRREVKKFKDRIRKRLARLARVQEPQVRVRR